MKYFNLIQICEFLQNFSHLSYIKRVGDNLFKLRLNGDFEIFFDLDKTISNIHINDNFLENKIYKAPFDILLQKCFTKSKILEISVPKNNRILKLKTEINSSYKSIKSIIIFEFTGRFTNAIILDENYTILEALRHQENDIRAIKVGKKFIDLSPIEIKEKNREKIENMYEFLKGEFNRISTHKFLNLKISKISQIDKKIENLKENLATLGSKDELLKKAEILSKKANLLMMNLYNLDDFSRDISLIDLSGNLINFRIENSPKITINEYFNETKKLKQKANNLHLQIENLNEKLNFYLNLKNLIQNSSSLSELEILLPKNKKTTKFDKENQNIQNFYIKNYKISVGKNEKANEILLKSANKDDFWFHIKDIPSSHVIVKTNRQNLSEDIIEFAAKICVNFSCKNSGKYLVDYTKRANIKIKNSAFVNYTNYKTITILKP